MLLRFGVENMYSFRDYQEISLVVPKVADQKMVSGLLHSPAIKMPVVPVVGVYGANASGKSNLLEAMGVFFHLIIASHQFPGLFSQAIVPFLLNENDNSSRMDCDIIVDSMHYQYGFRINKKQVLEEWLYAFSSSSRSRVIFHRNSQEKEEYYFGPSLKGNNKTIQEQTREDSLFLTTAATNNHKILFPLWRHVFKNISFAWKPDQRGQEWSSSLLGVIPVQTEIILSYLKDADIGISGIHIVDVSEQSKKDLLEGKRARLIEEVDQNFPFKEVLLEHHGGEKNYVLPYHLESRGTKTMLGFAVLVSQMLAIGGLLVVDELESGLHPFAAKRLIELFQSELHNPLGAQLIFASHNHYLIEDTLSAAQVWLCEKNSQGATEIFPIAATQPRKEENLARGYLKGRYGGVPFLGPLEEVWGHGPASTSASGGVAPRPPPGDHDGPLDPCNS